MPEHKLKILIADDHALFRTGVVQLLNQLEETVDVVEATNIEETLGMVTKHSDADLLLLDIYMPGSKDFTSLTTIREQFSLLPVIVLSANSSNELIHHAFKLGCAGVINKGESNKLILNAIRVVLSGGSYFPPQAFKLHEAPPQGVGELTDRQSRILELIGNGFSNKTIARELDISVNTVKSHVAAIFKILDVKNRTEAVQRAKEKPLRF